MADPDRFLHEALAQSACLPASAENVELKDLTSGVFVSIVWRCLAQIQKAEPHLEFQIPEDVDAQGGVAARHRVGSQLANILKELGYAGDCGYNHFLYPNEKESRSILSWLVGKLPRMDDPKRSVGVTQAAPTVDCLAEQPLADIFTKWMKKKTLYVLPNSEVPRLRGFEKLPLRSSPISFAWSKTDSALSGSFQSRLDDTSQAVSVLEAIAIAQRRETLNLEDLDDVDDSTTSSYDFGGRIKDDFTHGEADASTAVTKTDSEVELVDEFSAMTLPPFFVSAAGALKENAMAQMEAAEPTLDQPKTDDDSNAAQSPEPHELSVLEEQSDQASLEHIHVRLMETQQQIERLREELTQDEDELIVIRSRLDEMKAQSVVLNQEITAKRQLLGLLPQAEENIAKLEAVCAKNELKLQELAKEWETHKRPLESEEQLLMTMKSNRKARCRQFVAEMKLFRTEMKDMATTIQEKMEALRVLDKTYANLPQNINRNSYTNRIMDIIKQVHKQKQDIGRIIEDIKSIQKQLNFSSEKLKRSEAVTEEKLFGEASKQVDGSKDPNNPYVECYRKFAQVRELFEELILVVGDVGKKENATRDLENWITQLQGRDSSEQLNRVLADLQSVRQENVVLNEQIRVLRAKE